MKKGAGRTGPRLRGSYIIVALELPRGRNKAGPTKPSWAAGRLCAPERFADFVRAQRPVQANIVQHPLIQPGMPGALDAPVASPSAAMLSPTTIIRRIIISRALRPPS